MKKQITKYIGEDVLVVKLRYSYECKNGYKAFAITADLYDRNYISGESYIKNKDGKKRYLGSCGCLHDEIKEHAPELAHLIKWHLMSDKGPLHYIANTLYWVKENNLNFARSSAIWDKASLNQLTIKNLERRLTPLLNRFNRVMNETFSIS